VPASDLALGCGQESDPDTGRNKKRPTRVGIAQGLQRDINVLNSEYQQLKYGGTRSAKNICIDRIRVNNACFYNFNFPQTHKGFMERKFLIEKGSYLPIKTRELTYVDPFCPYKTCSGCFSSTRPDNLRAFFLVPFPKSKSNIRTVLVSPDQLALFFVPRCCKRKLLQKFTHSELVASYIYSI
jgi:hypothetical protein